MSWRLPSTLRRLPAALPSESALDPLAVDRNGARVPDAVPVPAAGVRVRHRSQEGIGRLSDGDRRAGRAGRHPPDAAHGRDRGPAQPRVRRGGRMGDRQVQLSRQESADHADRPALFRVAGHRRAHLRADLRPAGLVRRVARRARHEDHLRGSGHRARHRVRHVPVRRARADPADAGAGHRAGRGGDRARRARLADVLADHAAQREVGAALRRHPVQRARDGRIRRRVRRVRPHSRPDQHAAAARGNPLQRIPVRGGVRVRVAARTVGARHARAQVCGRAARARDASTGSGEP